jgi:hypothetical protein
LVESGSHRSVLGLSIVACFGLGGWNVADGFEQAPVVEPVDPVQGGELDDFQASPQASSGSFRSCRGRWWCQPRRCRNYRHIDHHTASGRSALIQWIRVTAPHHPWLGRVVRVMRRLRRAEGTDLLVVGEDGQRLMIPLAETVRNFV